MGLIYKMPTTVEETSNIIILDDGKILIKSYPPSKTLWHYFYLVIASVLIMSFVTKSLIITLLDSINYIDKLLGSLTVLAFISVPGAALALLCYQKRIIKCKNSINVNHYILGIKFRNQKIQPISYNVEIQSITPNQARINANKEFKSYNNKDYYNLFVTDSFQTKTLLDRSTNQNSMHRLMQILSK